MNKYWQWLRRGLIDLINFWSVPPRWIFLLIAIVIVMLFLWEPCAYLKESCVNQGDCP